MLKGEYVRAAAYAGGTLTRKAAEITFNDLKRSTTTPDIIEKLGPAFQQAFGVE